MAVRVSGHFGEWVQGRIGLDGPMALVTIACDALAAYEGAPSKAPPFAQKAQKAFLSMLGLEEGHAHDQIALDMPLGGGAGGSTAFLVAFAKRAGFAGPAEVLAQACLAVEGAVDPLMFAAPDQILWNSRRACCIEMLPPPPKCEIIGGFWQAPVITDPKDYNFADVSDLLDQWRKACENNDLSLAAFVATQSGQRRLAMRGCVDPMDDLAEKLGALGIARAHTGSARGLIFPQGGVPNGWENQFENAGLHNMLRFTTGGAR